MHFLMVYTNSRFAPTASGCIGFRFAVVVVAIFAVGRCRLLVDRALGRWFARAGHHRRCTHHRNRGLIVVPVTDFVRLERFVVQIFRFGRLVGDGSGVVDDRHGQLVEGRYGRSRWTDAGITGLEEKDVGGVRLDGFDLGLDHLVAGIFANGQLGDEWLGNEDFVFFRGCIPFGFLVAHVLETDRSDGALFGLAIFGLGRRSIVQSVAVECGRSDSGDGSYRGGRRCSAAARSHSMDLGDGVLRSGWGSWSGGAAVSVARAATGCPESVHLVLET